MPQNTLATVQAGRDNNFNLLRFLAALAVVITHAVALSKGMGGTSALHVLGTYLSILAPDVFFVISGYLVTASLLSRNDALRYLRARVVRIYPALWVTVLTTVFIIGAVCTSLPLSAYLSDRQTWAHVLRNVTVVGGVSDNLPGVFTTHPLPDSVNGSLWTMPTEVRMYLALLLLWWLAGRLSHRREFWMGVAALTAAVVFGAMKLWLEPRWGANPINALRLAPLFIIGCAMYLWRGHIPLRRDLFWLGIGAMLVTLPWLRAFFVAEFFAIGYVSLYLAYVPGGLVRRFNRFGDCSYGIYIQSFPLQQLLVFLIPGIGVWALMGLSVVLSILVGTLSWHLIEKRALAAYR